MSTNKALFAGLLFTLAAGLACGQDGEGRRYNGSGYATFGVGGCQHRYVNLSVSGGGEAFLWRGLSLGGEVGYYQFRDWGNSSFGIATLNPGYHFTDRRLDSKFDPYVTVGLLGVGFTSRWHTGAGSLGAGLNYWLKNRIGIRAEGRIYGVSEEVIAKFRIGLVFR